MIDHNRFSVDVDRVLLSSGWFPGRDITPQLEKWTQSLASNGFVIFPKVSEFLREFGNIRIEQFQNAPSGYLPLIFDPISYLLDENGDAFSVKEQFDLYSSLLGQNLYPIGYNLDSNSYFTMSEDGKIFEFLDHMEMIGMDTSEAFSNIITGRRPKEIYLSVNW